MKHKNEAKRKRLSIIPGLCYRRKGKMNNPMNDFDLKSTKQADKPVLGKAAKNQTLRAAPMSVRRKRPISIYCGTTGLAGNPSPKESHAGTAIKRVKLGKKYKCKKSLANNTPLFDRFGN